MGNAMQGWADALSNFGNNLVNLAYQNRAREQRVADRADERAYEEGVDEKRFKRSRDVAAEERKQRLEDDATRRGRDIEDTKTRLKLAREAKAADAAQDEVIDQGRDQRVEARRWAENGTALSGMDASLSETEAKLDKITGGNKALMADTEARLRQEAKGILSERIELAKQALADTKNPQRFANAQTALVGKDAGIIGNIGGNTLNTIPGLITTNRRGDVTGMDLSKLESAIAKDSGMDNVGRNLGILTQAGQRLATQEEAARIRAMSGQSLDVAMYTRLSAEKLQTQSALQSAGWQRGVPFEEQPKTARLKKFVEGIRTSNPEMYQAYGYADLWDGVTPRPAGQSITSKAQSFLTGKPAAQAAPAVDPLLANSPIPAPTVMTKGQADQFLAPTSPNPTVDLTRPKSIAPYKGPPASPDEYGGLMGAGSYLAGALPPEGVVPRLGQVGIRALGGIADAGTRLGAYIVGGDKYVRQVSAHPSVQDPAGTLAAQAGRAAQAVTDVASDYAATQARDQRTAENLRTRAFLENQIARYPDEADAQVEYPDPATGVKTLMTKGDLLRRLQQ